MITSSSPRRLLTAVATASTTVAALLTVGAGPARAATLPSNCTQALLSPVVCTFASTGAEQTFTVPAGVTSVSISAIGGSGGVANGGAGDATVGRGAQVSGTVAVSGGQTLYVEVGGNGGNSGGGFNGGGDTYFGGGGGGASDVRTQPNTTALTTADSRLIVAGGGGGVGSGAGNLSCGHAFGSGGDAGAAGQAGAVDSTCSAGGGGGGGGGQPGTATQGGAGGATQGKPDSGSGSLGQGETAVSSGRVGLRCYCSKGAGGGGYYGGGSGGDAAVDFVAGVVYGAGGGGGGSSLVPAGGSGPTPTSAAPSVSISYQLPLVTIGATTTTITGVTPEPSVLDQSATVNYTVTSDLGTPAGAVTVTADDGSTCTGTVAAGSCTISAFARAGDRSLTAAYAGEVLHASSTSAAVTHTVDKVPQQITVTGAPSSAEVGDTYTPNATAPGGTVEVTINPDTTGFQGSSPACTITGATVSFASAGTCIIDFTQDGNDEYAPASEVQRDVAVGLKAQSISAGDAPSPVKVGDTYTPVASAPGGTVTVSIDSSTDGYGTGTVACTTDGTTVSYTHVGSCVIDLDQAGDSTYAAAPRVQQTVAVGQQAQKITVTSTPASPATVGGTYDAEASSDSGLPVTVTVDATTTHSACSVSGSSVSLDHIGTCVLDYDQAGNGEYSAASRVQQTFEVTAKGLTVTLTSSRSPIVFGQPVTFTATETAADGTHPAGSMYFRLKGHGFGGATAVDSHGQATRMFGPGVDPGLYTLDATFVPDDQTVYDNTATPSFTQVIDQASTRTAVSVHQTTLKATVTAVSPGAGTPTGTVSFTVGGKSVGTAPVKGNGTASLTGTSAPRGTVGATYHGDTDFMMSTGSTSHRTPTITASVSSKYAKTRFGWYRSPVTVRFRCAAGSAPLAGSCPKPVTLSHNAAAQKVSRTITATDGANASVSVSINIDRIRPSVRVSGVRNGASYTTAPTPRCIGKDTLSGVASCRIATRTSGLTVSYTATAVDRAGNSSAVHGKYTVARVALLGASYRDGSYDVRAGQVYTMVVYSAGRPTYYDAAVYPGEPGPRDNPFRAAGHDRWTLPITMQRSLLTHRYWNLGAKVGKTLYVVKIRVS